MIERSLSALHRYRILDPRDQIFYYGCDQEWYTTKWKRMAGCGPTTASNLILYHRFKERPEDNLTVEGCVQLMDELWSYVTPGFGGVNTTRKFLNGLHRYLEKQSLPSATRVLDIPKAIEKRPDLKTTIAFLDQALSEDLPVAFLNLHNGETKELDEWHWVTIVGLCYPETLDSLCVRIMDAGKLFELDLALWLRTTKDKGGFICMPSLVNQ